MRRWLPDPFLLFLLGTVLLATVLPAHGVAARIVGWASTATVVLLFFFHGAKLARHEVAGGLANWRIHLAIFGATFVMFPLVGLGLNGALAGRMPPALLTGILFLCCLPSTVQSAIAFVSIARGNVAAAVASASVSQMLGVVLTPALMALFASTHGGGGGLRGIGEVAVQIVVPFVAGQIARPLVIGWIGRHRQLVGLTDRSTILIAVYGAFSAAVIEGLWHKLPLPALAGLLVVDGVVLAIGLVATWAIGRAGGFAIEDRIAILFCGTKKSLVQGVPMAKVLFPPAQAGVILLPIMLFHQMQLMACAVIARRYAARNDTGEADNR